MWSFETFFKMARLNKNEKGYICLIIEYNFLLKDAWDEVTLPRIIGLILKRKLKIEEIQVTIKCLHENCIKNLELLLKIFSHTLKSFKIQQSGDERKYRVQFAPSILPPQVKRVGIKLINQKQLEIIEPIKTDRVYFSCENQSDSELLKNLQPKRAMLLELKKKDIEPYLKHFSSLEDYDPIKRKISKLFLIVNSTKSEELNEDQLQVMNNLNIILLDNFVGKLDQNAIKLASMHFPEDVKNYLNQFQFRSKSQAVEGIQSVENKYVELKDAWDIIIKDWGGQDNVLISLTPKSMVNLPNISQLSNLLNRIETLQKEGTTKQIIMDLKISEEIMRAEIKMQFQQNQFAKKSIQFEVSDMPIGENGLQCTSDFIAAFSQLESYDDLTLSAEIDSYSSLNKMIELSNKVLALKGKALQKLTVQFRFNYHIEESEEVYDNDKIINEFDKLKNIVSNCKNLEELSIQAYSEFDIVPTLIFLALDNNLPNLKVLTLPKTFTEFSDVSDALLTFPASKLSTSLQAIKIVNMVRPQIHSAGETYKTLVTALLPHLNSGQKIEIEPMYDTFDIEDYDMLVGICEPHILIKGRVNIESQLLQKYKERQWTPLKKLIIVADLMEKVSDLNPIE
ncbi:hypothetical protein FGO68_gene4601 [Halteria grandinella]|uniref:Uncharacterized protein n=1 Tax=Halteria grandinella TaxID=5974 RepID=A0A8J8NE32_HALGN|nr:hypothetical protein FGO68_gene4601 [Halteria grandinella]